MRDQLGEIVSQDFYIYQEQFSAVASGGSATGNINIQADSSFTVQKLTAFADIGGAAQTDSSRVLPLATVQITDSGSGRQLFEAAVPIPNLFGSGELPFILPKPRLFMPRSTITVTVSNYSAGTTYANIYLSFIGFKTFYQGGIGS